MSLHSAWKTYNKLLVTRPYLMQSVQTGILLGTGDFLSQKFVAPGDHYNYPRTLRFVFLGVCLGPVIHRWLVILDRKIGCQNNLSTCLKKVFADQLLFSPLVSASILSSLTALEGGNITEKMVNTYPDILLNSYKLWPAVQIFNFRFVPLQYRVFFIQTVALGWNTYLAWRINYDVME